MYRAIEIGALLVVCWAVSVCAHGGPVTVGPSYSVHDERVDPRAEPLVLEGVALPVTETVMPTAKIEVDATSVEDWAEVIVSWSGIAHPTKQDFIGVYAPSTRDATDYTDWQWASYGWDSKPSGEGSLKFVVYNIRTVDYVFRYIWNNTVHDQYESVATSNRVTFKEGPSSPMHAHIAITGRSGEVRVHFTTNANKTPVVEYGLAKGGPFARAVGTSTTYSASDMCDGGAIVSGGRNFIDPGYLHDVLISDLKPNTTYYYRFGHDDHMSSRMVKFTSPADLETTERTRVIAYGDMGVTVPQGGAGGAQSTVDRVEEELARDHVNMILHIGDISYARGIAILWDQFMYHIEHIASTIPYMVSIGNHEYDYLKGGKNDPSKAGGNGFHPSWGNYGDDSNGECAVPVVNRFHMPDNGNKVFWYSMNYGLAHYVMLSSEHDYFPGSPQYKWLESDLKSVDRHATPWVIVTAHRPMYSSEDYRSDYDVSLGMRRGFENLLQTYQVDLFLAGHYHSYERTCSVFNGKCVDAGASEHGTVHVVIGMAGAGLDDADYYGKKWSVYHDQVFGYARMEVFRNKLIFEYVHNESGEVADAFTLTKPSHNYAFRGTII